MNSVVNQLWIGIEFQIYGTLNRQFTHKPFYKIYENFVGKWAAPHFPSNLQNYTYDELKDTCIDEG